MADPGDASQHYRLFTTPKAVAGAAGASAADLRARLQAGAGFASRYHELRLLGAGGMGRVLLHHDALIGRDDMAIDARFATNRSRLENVDALELELSAAIRQRTTDEWFELLEPANACALGKVNTIADLFEDPHVAARGMLVDIPMPYGKPGTLTLPNSPLHLSNTPTVVGQTMPEHGGDTDRVLARWLGGLHARR